MLSTQKAEIRLPLPDKEVRYLNDRGIGASVTLHGDVAGLPQQWQATIVRSEGVIDDRSRMTYLVAEVIDPYGLASPKQPLRFGSYITANIKGRQAQSVTTVARHLIVDNKIALLDDNNQLKYQKVQVLREQGAQVVISEGLESGMRVITSPLDYPIAGMALALEAPQPIPEDTLTPSTQLAMDDKE